MDLRSSSLVGVPSCVATRTSDSSITLDSLIEVSKSSPANSATAVWRLTPVADLLATHGRASADVQQESELELIEKHIGELDQEMADLLRPHQDQVERLGGARSGGGFSIGSSLVTEQSRPYC